MSTSMGIRPGQLVSTLQLYDAKIYALESAVRYLQEELKAEQDRVSLLSLAVSDLERAAEMTHKVLSSRIRALEGCS